MLPSRKDIDLAVEDVRGGLSAWRLWGTIGWQDIRQRYRRSVVGPFWLSLGMMLNIAAIGIVWGELFKMDVKDFVPYLTLGILMWSLITETLQQGSTCYIDNWAMIKQMRRPYSMYAFLVVWRSLLIFFHNSVVYLIVAAIFVIVPSPAALLLPLALALVMVSISWAIVLFGMLSARFRDVPLVVTNFLVIAFFISPVMWKRSQLGAYAYIADFNPFTHMLALVREPLLGGYAGLESWLALILVSAIGWTVAFLFFARFRNRIAYWL
jgi:lipopolysaccharide transport system permease protein